MNCKENDCNLLIDIFEFELQFSLLFVSLAHHLIEVVFDLDHLVVQTTELLILLLCGFVHTCFVISANKLFLIISNYNYIIGALLKWFFTSQIICARPMYG